jgi:hypothetical protein
LLQEVDRLTGAAMAGGGSASGEGAVKSWVGGCGGVTAWRGAGGGVTTSFFARKGREGEAARDAGGAGDSGGGGDVGEGRGSGGAKKRESILVMLDKDNQDELRARSNRRSR